MDDNKIWQVWDWDRVGSGNFLGSCSIRGAALKGLIEDSKFAATWFDLTKSDYLPEALQELVQGQIQIRAGFSGHFRWSSHCTHVTARINSFYQTNRPSKQQHTKLQI